MRCCLVSCFSSCVDFLSVILAWLLSLDSLLPLCLFFFVSLIISLSPRRSANVQLAVLFLRSVDLWKRVKGLHLLLSLPLSRSRSRAPFLALPPCGSISFHYQTNSVLFISVSTLSLHLRHLIFEPACFVSRSLSFERLHCLAVQDFFAFPLFSSPSFQAGLYSLISSSSR